MRISVTFRVDPNTALKRPTFLTFFPKASANFINCVFLDLEILSLPQKTLFEKESKPKEELISQKEPIFPDISKIDEKKPKKLSFRAS